MLKTVDKCNFHDRNRTTEFICFHFLASALDTNINCVILLTGYPGYKFEPSVEQNVDSRLLFQRQLGEVLLLDHSKYDWNFQRKNVWQ